MGVTFPTTLTLPSSLCWSLAFTGGRTGHVGCPPNVGITACLDLRSFRVVWADGEPQQGITGERRRDAPGGGGSLHTGCVPREWALALREPLCTQLFSGSRHCLLAPGDSGR